MSSGRIPQSFLDELLVRTDIVELIGARIQLRRAGNSHVALCPFHHEKTPSFNVNPAKQLFHCFGCDASGNAISFLMQYDRLEFIDAVETLAGQLGLPIPYENNAAVQAQTQHLKPLYALLDQSAGYFQAQLRNAAVAIGYLKNRGLTGKICKQFGIGFAPVGRDHLLRQLAPQQEDIEHLVTAGMLIRNSSGECYDRFRHRVMFPIRDVRGRVIAFGGRAIHSEDQPKYLNSPETPLFHKGHELYGLYEARQANKSLTRVLVVEGYMDVVALAQHGFSNVVATLGTAISTRQIQRLLRYCKEVIFCFDGDHAGRQAAWRGLEATLPLMHDGIQILFLFLPDGEDPDSLVRKEGQQAFQQRLQAATPLSDFFFQQLSMQTDMSTLDGRSRLSSLAQPLLQRIPSGIFRQLMQQRLAELIGIAVEKLDNLQSPVSIAAGRDLPLPKRVVSGLRTPLRLAITLLVQHPPLAEQVADEQWLRDSELSGADALFEMLVLIKQQPTITTAALLEHWRNRKEGARLAALASEEHGVPLAGMQAEFQDILTYLHEKDLQQAIDKLLKLASQRMLTPEEQQRLERLLEQRQQSQFK
ncbi:MAG: DNA primase [Gammaproteobacteria bacterium]